MRNGKRELSFPRRQFLIKSRTIIYHVRPPVRHFLRDLHGGKEFKAFQFFNNCVYNALPKLGATADVLTEEQQGFLWTKREKTRKRMKGTGNATDKSCGWQKQKWETGQTALHTVQPRRPMHSIFFLVLTRFHTVTIGRGLKMYLAIACRRFQGLSAMMVRLYGHLWFETTWISGVNFRNAFRHAILEL